MISQARPRRYDLRSRRFLREPDLPTACTCANRSSVPINWSSEVAQIERNQQPKQDALSQEFLQKDRPAGRVRHDERGRAVWDWAVASGEYAKLSATNMMKKLDIADLKIEETQRAMRALAAPQGRDVGGGGDPYNQRGSGQRPGEAGQRQGVTGSPDRNKVLDQLLGKK
jgi:hypothetical protein